MKVKIKTPAARDITNRLKNLINQRFVIDFDSSVVNEIKRLIASGQSPVKGFGRFPQYKDRLNYPGKRKPATPVNLFLSGDMLKHYTGHQLNEKSMGIGYASGTPQNIKDRAEGNNIGANKIPARRHVPLSGEEFTISVMRKIKDVFARRIAELFK